MDLLMIYDPDVTEYFNESQTSGNLEDNDHQLFKGFSSVLLNTASVCCLMFMLLGIPGNLITIIALARCKKVRNATAVFIINLSLSDLLFCCFNLPLAASTFYHRQWIYGDLMCRLFPLFRYGLLAVSLFTILAITINRYIMIGHPRIYARVYRRRYLVLMVAMTWLSAFGALIQTWRGKWGKFGLDVYIGSCSILPSSNGASPKEFLFLMAFALPCCAIVLCYARIFYIVRKTALKIQDNQPRENGSVKFSNKSKKWFKRNDQHNQEIQVPKIVSDERNDSLIINQDNSNSESLINGQRMRKLLSKSRDDDMKFIDTSVESDLPPTLSQLQRKSVQIIIDQPSSIINQLSAINSTEEQEAVSSEGNEITKATDIVSPEPSTSSATDIPFDQNILKPSRETVKSNAKTKQKKLKDETRPKETRKKSLANTSGASILYAGRMSSKDRRLLKMILVIFLSFLTCYLPITLSKVLRSISEINLVFIGAYLLVYLTTCINPMIYVVMSSEYRQAYKNLLMCRNGRAAHNYTNSKRRI